MSVDSLHPEYEKMIAQWAEVRAASSGHVAVKKLKTAVLPAPGVDERGNYDRNRYKSYLARAIYTNVTGRTKSGLVGAAFRLPPQVDLPPGIDYLDENANGAGQSLEHLSKEATGEALDTGRPILMVDYPEVDESMTLEEQELLNPRAHIHLYKAESLINWKTQVIGGQTVLTLAVLREMSNKAEDEFKHDEEDQYRVLRLRSEGYTQQLYGKDLKPIDDERIIRKFDGSPFREITLFVCGGQNNGPSVDDIPLADIAHVNIGHFRNSADLEENSFVHGQMTLGITTNLDHKQWQEANPHGVIVGAQAGHYLGESGGFHTAQASENQIADRLQERKEAQMLALGARLVEQKNPNETAAAAKIDATGENSVLADLVSNIEEGIVKSIGWVAEFMGDSSEFEFKMNREFFPNSIDPQVLMAAIQGHNMAILPKSQLQNAYRKAGVVDPEVTNDQLNEELGVASPLE